MPTIVPITAANAARKNDDIAECQLFMDNFANNTATIADRRQYADCVDYVHPSETDPMFTIIFIGLILSMIIGGAMACKDGAFDLTEWLLLFILWTIISMSMLFYFGVCLSFIIFG